MSGRAAGARPYKLLIYEPGGFFAAHRDSEKADGMVGTLSVSLPAVSAGVGGDLVVRHGGREMRADMSVSEPSELAWAAFYAEERDAMGRGAAKRVAAALAEPEKAGNGNGGPRPAPQGELL